MIQRKVITLIASCVILRVSAFASDASTTRWSANETMAFASEYVNRYYGHRMGTSMTRLEHGLRMLQREAGLPSTGLLDDNLIELMRTPRCGIVDVVEDDGAGQRSRRHPRWPRFGLTWSLRDFPKHLGNRSVVERIMLMALLAWSRETPLSFKRARDVGDIDASFYSRNHGDGSPFDGRGGTLAHAFMPFFPNEPLSGDTHFDADEDWRIGSTNRHDGTDLFSVAVHEFGHALGLFHSNDTESIMYPFYTKIWNPRSFIMPRSDKESIRGLYGKRDRETTAINPSSTTTSATTTTISDDEDNDYDDNDSIKTHFVFSLLRNELFVFRDNSMWRVRHGRVLYGYPVHVSRFFRAMRDVKRVDAIYESTRDHDIVIITDSSLVFRFRDTYLRSGYPRTLADEYGLPANARVTKFIAARDGKTYIVGDNRFWYFDERTRHLVGVDEIKRREKSDDAASTRENHDVDLTLPSSSVSRVPSSRLVVATVVSWLLARRVVF